MKRPIEIRRAGLEDVDALGYVHAMGWQATYRGIATEDYMKRFTPQARADFFRGMLETSDNEQYLLRWEDTAAGMLALGRVQDPPEGEGMEDSGEIIALYMLPAFQRRGIGRDAMTFAMERLRELGYRDVMLRVLRQNLRARRFYELQGFTRFGQVESFDMGVAVEELCYRRALK